MLTFNTTTRTFTGNPPKGALNLSLTVTATDSATATVAKTFALVLTGSALNDAPTGGVTITNNTNAGRGTATLQQGDVLSAANNLVDPDGPGTLTVAYTWYADGVQVGTGSTFTLAQAQVGKKITVTASYTDAGSVLERVSSAATSAVVDVNEAPALTGAPASH